MKELRSRKHPDFAPQILSDEAYEQLKKKGLAKRYTVKDIKPFKSIMPPPIIKKVEVIKKETKKTDK